MDKLVIRGGARLKGEVRVAGAKNATLPLLASTLLAGGRTTLRNAPSLGDVDNMRALLTRMGAVLERKSGAVSIDTSGVTDVEAPYDVVRTMRASVLVLGPLVARHGQARVAMPGGCVLGPRPIDQHLKGLEALGATVQLDAGTIVARAPKGLRGATIVFDVVTVTGTETLMMAAALAKGRTTLENAACEPEIEELGRVLNKMGARVRGAGTHLVNIEGVDELHPVDHAVMPDRIEAATLMIAAAVTRGNVLVRDCLPEHLDAFLAKLRATGADIQVEGEGVRVRGRTEIHPADLATRPYPGFPTDAQPPFTVLMTLARGQSVLTENVFENRFMHVAELRRMGADIVIEGRTAVVRGPSKLTGTRVMASDLRASASLVLAGLCAEGNTEVSPLHHLDRGYERLERKLRTLGAEVRRTRATS